MSQANAFTQSAEVFSDQIRGFWVREADLRKLTLDAVEAETERRKIYGGQPLTETVKLLQSICKTLF